MDVPSMRYFIFLVFFLNIAGTSIAEITKKIPPNLSEEQQISFFRGYLLWQEYLQRPGVRYDFDQVINGMCAAEQGKLFPCDEEELRIKIRQFQEKILAKQTEDNLADAEAFLAKIANEGAVELVPGKLYYKRLQNGNTKVVQPQSIPLLTYSIWSYNRWGETEVISFEDPLPISLQDTIPGFAQGVSGMHEGEVRKLFVHPDLAYGTYGKLDPNLLLIFEIKVVCNDSR
jgi:peptidylprolyl isomerase